MGRYKNTLGNIFKSRQQHAIISCIEVVYVNKHEIYSEMRKKKKKTHTFFVKTDVEILKKNGVFETNTVCLGES